MRTLAVALALSLPLAAAEPPIEGTLCVFTSTEKKPVCEKRTGEKLTVAATDNERLYVWTNSGRNRVVLGRIDAKNETLDLNGEALRPVSVTVRGDRSRGWPAPLKVTIADMQKRTWSWVVPAREAETLSELRLPRGRYTVTFEAEHHLEDRRRFEIPQTATLREVALRPIPMISGTVTGADDKPLLGAQILRASDRKVIATTNEQGAFRGEAGSPLPDSVIIEKAGLGSRVIPVAFPAGDADLGAIQLSRGLKLTIRVTRPESIRDPLQVHLLLNNKFKYEPTPAGRKELAVDESTLVFDDVAKGDYMIVVQGRGEGEVLIKTVTVEDDKEIDVSVEPFRVEGTALLGDEPLEGTLQFSERSDVARFTIPIEKGRFTATMWRRGELHAWVNVPSMRFGQPVTSPQLGADPSTWEIRFPKRLISGRIHDAETGKPVADVGMNYLITTHEPKSRLYVTAKVNDDGTYSLLAIHPGTYEIKVSSEKYAPEKKTIEVRAEDGSSTHDFALVSGIETAVDIAWSSGAPVTRASILEGVASDGHNAERYYSLTAPGKLVLRLRRGEVRTLFIIPEEGSFAIARVTPQSDPSKSLRVVVPPAAASMRIQVTADDNEKPPPVRIAMRYDGEELLTPVLAAIGRRATGGSSMTDRNLLFLPAGSYEVWPIGIESRTPRGPSKTVTLSSGDVVVEVKAK